MPYSEDNNTPVQSSYPELELPEFESTIPQHLLKDVSKENQFVMENINIQTQYIKWLCEAAIDTNTQVRLTNGRLKKVETWKDKISSVWVTAAAILTFSGTIILIAAKFYKTVFTNSNISIF